MSDCVPEFKSTTNTSCNIVGKAARFFEGRQELETKNVGHDQINVTKAANAEHVTHEFTQRCFSRVQSNNMTQRDSKIFQLREVGDVLSIWRTTVNKVTNYPFEISFNTCNGLDWNEAEKFSVYRTHTLPQSKCPCQFGL